MNNISFKIDEISINDQDDNNIKRILLSNLSFDVHNCSNLGIYGLNDKQYQIFASSLAWNKFSTLSINNKSCNKGDVHYIPNENLIFPSWSVLNNITLDFNESKKNNSVMNILEMVDLVGYENTIPRNEESGFNYRIAIARAIYHSARLIIFSSFNNLENFALAGLEKIIFSELPRIGVMSIIPIKNSYEILAKKIDSIVIFKDNGQLGKVVKIEKDNSLTSNLD